MAASIKIVNHWRGIDSKLALDALSGSRDGRAMQRPLPLVLRHIDASRNMARFYMLSIEPNLLGTVSLVRQWGRIGSMGQCKIELFDRYEEAVAAFEHLGIAKRRKGYCICT